MRFLNQLDFYIPIILKLIQYQFGVSTSMLHRLGNRFRLRVIYSQILQLKSSIGFVRAAYSSQKSNKQTKPNTLENHQSLRDKAFLAFYTLYGLKHIDHKELLKQEKQFDTIRENILRSKSEIIYHQESKINQGTEGGNNKTHTGTQDKTEKVEINILKANARQFFSAFEIGQGVMLPQKIFFQDRMAMARDAQEKSVFNLTSITKKVLKFTLDDKRVLKGNSGIGKTWAHACINYLSINIWNYFMKYPSLQEIYKLVQLNLKLFENIHIKNGDSYEADLVTSQRVMQQMARIPFQFFLQLNETITWQQIVDTLHFQCPEIEIPQTVKPKRLQNQEDLAYDKRVYENEANWANEFLTNMAKTFKNYNNIKLVLNIDQANIYFGKLMQIDLIDQKVTYVEANKSFSKQRKQRIFHQTENELRVLQKQARHLSNILRVLYQSQIGNKIKLNCAELVGFDIKKLFIQQIKPYFNMFKHQPPSVQQLQYGIQVSSLAGQKQMWSNFWFQIQRNIYKKADFQDQSQAKICKMTVKKLKLRQCFNNMFDQKNKNDSNAFKYRWIFTVQLLVLRCVFNYFDVKDSFQSCVSCITNINKQLTLILEKSKWSIQQIQITSEDKLPQQLREQLKIFWDKNNQVAQKYFKTFVSNCFNEIYKKSTEVTKERSAQVFFYSTIIDKHNKHKIFLLILKRIVKDNEKEGLKYIKQSNNKQFVLTAQGVQKLLSQLLNITAKVAEKHNRQNMSDAEIILKSLIDRQYMQIKKNQQHENQLLVMQSADDFFQRVKKNKVNDSLKNDYRTYILYKDLSHIKIEQVKRYMTLLLSEQQHRLKIGGYQFSIVNKKIQSFIHFNYDMKKYLQTEDTKYLTQLQAKKIKKSLTKKQGKDLQGLRFYKKLDENYEKTNKDKITLRKNIQSYHLEEAITALCQINEGQALGFRPTTYDDKYSAASRWFDLLLIRKGFSAMIQLLRKPQKSEKYLASNSKIYKTQIFTIDFSLGQKISDIQDNIQRVEKEFYVNYIKGNQQFLKKYGYLHMIICRSSVYSKIRESTISIPQFIKIISIKDVEFIQKNLVSEQKLIAEIQLQQYKKLND